jgi:DNA replication and repair protein RecF
MFLTELSLLNFRNIEKQTIPFENDINIIFGKNGQGKTSLLEAIFFFSITKSFRTNAEKTVLQHDKEYFDIKGMFTANNSNRLDARVYYSHKEGKNIFLNSNKLKKYSELIGIFPAILLSLEDMELISGDPGNRRRFMDILLSQVNPLYLQSLQKYKKSLQQRNKLLSLINAGESKRAALEPWDSQLITYGMEIIEARMALGDYLNRQLSGFYRMIAKTDDEIGVKFKSNVLDADGGLNRDYYSKKLFNAVEGDILRQRTNIGPHRDDIEFLKDGFPIKAYGSQGENKTLLIALKFCESQYLKERLKEDPLILMDDIFGELDISRINNLLNYLPSIGQTFITTTLRNKFEQSGLKNPAYIQIERGAVVQ